MPAQRAMKHYLPFLAPFYRVAEPLGYAIIRVVVGLTMLPHGWGKLHEFGRFADGLAKRGWEPAVVLTGLVTFTEFFGAILVVIGLFTRFAAAAMAIELAIITFTVHWANGFAWTARGWEYPMMWGIICFGIALRGGGRYSVDRLIGREL